jgi:hypothetical protein
LIEGSRNFILISTKKTAKNCEKALELQQKVNYSSRDAIPFRGKVSVAVSVWSVWT